LGNSRKLGEQLGNSVPQVETTNYQGVEDNLGNKENTPSNNSPSFEEKELPPDNSGNDLAQSDLEGGKVPQPSPTLTQEQESQEIESVSAVKDNLGNDSPTIPHVPQICDNSPESDVTVDASGMRSLPVPKPEMLMGWGFDRFREGVRTFTD
jgi:hypothetical protein